MTTNELEQPSSNREQALTRLKKRRDFQGHVIAYLIINAALWGGLGSDRCRLCLARLGHWRLGDRSPPERLGGLFSGAHHGG